MGRSTEQSRRLGALEASLFPARPAGGASLLETRLRKAGGLEVGEDREAGAGPEIKAQFACLAQQ